MQRIRLPLLLTMVLTLMVTGLLPVAISFFQLRSNKDALLEQVQRTHMVAARSVAARLDAELETLRVIAEATASHPALIASATSVESQNLFRGALAAQPALAAIGVYDSEGERVVLAQRIDLRDVISELESGPGESIALVTSGGRPWLRIRQGISDREGSLLLVAEADSLNQLVRSTLLGESAQLFLGDASGDLLLGDPAGLEALPAELLEAASSGRLGAGSARYQEAKLIAAYARLSEAPWFVLSRQPSAVAEVAQHRIRRATWISALGALALTGLLSALAYFTAIRPLRRMVEQLGGEVSGGQGWSEIGQLEAAIEKLRQGVREREELSKVFLGRYQVTDLIGSGAMGSVFRGWDPMLRRPVALKTVRLSASDGDQARISERLLQEAVTGARFSHPNIVTVYDVASEEAAAFIAMELVDGITLADYLESRGRLDAEESTLVGLAIAKGLQMAHDNDLVHCDIKPSNILLGLDGSIKVTDFGISELASPSDGPSETLSGTPGYVAPECLTGGLRTAASDLFALGVVLYECLTGQQPFSGQGSTPRQTLINTVVAELEPLDRVNPNVPFILSREVSGLLAKDPAERSALAEEVVVAFEKMVEEQRYRWKAERVAKVAVKKATIDQTDVMTATLKSNLAGAASAPPPA